jgi:hypothetical protein
MMSIQQFPVTVISPKYVWRIFPRQVIQGIACPAAIYKPVSAPEYAPGLLLALSLYKSLYRHSLIHSKFADFPDKLRLIDSHATIIKHVSSGFDSQQNSPQRYLLSLKWGAANQNAIHASRR